MALRLPNPDMYTDWKEWASRLVQQLLGQNSNSLVQLPASTVANLPDATKNKFAQIVVTDALNGITVAFSDGTDWLDPRDSYNPVSAAP